MNPTKNDGPMSMETRVLFTLSIPTLLHGRAWAESVLEKDANLCWLKNNHAPRAVLLHTKPIY